MLSIGLLTTALEVGLVYALVALSLFVSFSILDICDLSTDGCYTLGCAVGAMVTIAGHPLLAIVLALVAVDDVGEHLHVAAGDSLCGACIYFAGILVIGIVAEVG